MSEQKATKDIELRVCKIKVLMSEIEDIATEYEIPACFVLGRLSQVIYDWNSSDVSWESSDWSC